jgi:exopolysaccharide biosynthesis polyprenyl glycosylphosphotransferase
MIADLPGLPRPASLLESKIQLLNLFQLAALLLVWHLSFALLGLYHSRRLSTKLSELADVIKAVCLGIATVYLLDRVLQVHGLSTKLLIAFWGIAVLACVTARLIVRQFLQQIRMHGRNLRHLLIVGSNGRALELGKKIEARPWLGYHLLGFVDDPQDAHEALAESGIGLLASLDEFGSYISTHVVDEVIMCLPFQSYYRQAARLVNLCQEQGIIVRVSSDIFDLQLASARSDTFEGDRMVTISAGGMQGWPAVMKNLLDRTGSAIALIVLSPLLIVTAAIIRLTSPGPVFYVQERLGLNKRRFRLYKFRTMVVDAEAKQRQLETANEASGPVFKIRNDPRITRVGYFLRKYSVDELPQLVNVIKGDMSLVGPRPLPLRDCEGFRTDWHRRRFSVRPGLSCLWQISGRSSICFDDWMRLDMQYIDQWSLWLDMKIIAKTVHVVFRGVGAARFTLYVVV